MRAQNNLLKILILFYSLVTVITCQFLTDYFLLKSLLALPLVVLVPWLTGLGCVNLFKKNYAPLVIWALGFMLIFPLSLSLYYGIIIIMLSAFGFWKWQVQINKQDSIYYLIALSGGLIIAGAYTYFAPYPYLNDTDAFRHAKIISEILSGAFIFTPAYLPGFHALCALIIWLYNLSAQTFSLLWALRFITLPVYSLGCYLFYARVTGQKKLSVVGALLAALVNIEFVCLIDTAPKIFAYLSLPYVLFFVWQLKKQNYWQLIIIFTALLLLHWPMALVNIALTIGTLAFLNFKNKFVNYIFLSIALCGILYLALQYSGVLNLNGRALSIFGEADLAHYNFLTYSQNLLTYIPSVLMIFSLIGLLVYRQRISLLLGASIFGLAILYFSPLNASYRVLVAAVPLVMLGVCLFLIGFSAKIKYPGLKYLFLILSIGISFGLLMQSNYKLINFWQQQPLNEHKFSIAVPEEYAAAEWLKTHSEKNIAFASDPVTVTLFEGWSQHYSRTGYISGDILSAVMQQKNVEKAAAYLKANQPDQTAEIYVIISGRTTFWLSHDADKSILNAPNYFKPFKNFSGFDKFNTANYFKLVYSSPNIFIYQLI